VSVLAYINVAEPYNLHAALGKSFDAAAVSVAGALTLIKQA
jgi:hypothetical protein